jgi:hypothetical protein
MHRSDPNDGSFEWPLPGAEWANTQEQWTRLSSEAPCSTWEGRGGYDRQAKQNLDELKNETGFLIQAVLPVGIMITHDFGPKQTGGDVYTWIAGQESILRAGIRPRDFVLLIWGGGEILPLEHLDVQLLKSVLRLRVEIIRQFQTPRDRADVMAQSIARGEKRIAGLTTSA